MFIFLQKFSLSVACLFIVCYKEEVLNFEKVSLSVVSFKYNAFGAVSKKSSTYWRASKFSFMLSSRNFVVLYFTFRSVIHLELLFLTGGRSVSTLIFLLVLLMRIYFSFIMRNTFLFPPNTVITLWETGWSMNWDGGGWIWVWGLGTQREWPSILLTAQLLKGIHVLEYYGCGP